MQAISIVKIVRKKSLLMQKLKRFIRIFKREYTVYLYQSKNINVLKKSLKNHLLSFY